MSSKSFVLQPGEGRSIGGVRAPRFGPPMHIHRNAAEAFYVLEAEYVIFIDDEEIRCPTGSFVYIPAGAAHGFRVGDSASKKLNPYVLESMVGYFDELAAAVASGDVDDQRLLGAIAERYGMEVLGPVPDGYL